MQCGKGHQLITATQEVTTFYPDSEPFEADVEEDSGVDEIRAYVSIGILWCPECNEIVHVWIEEPHVSTGAGGGIRQHKEER